MSKSRLSFTVFLLILTVLTFTACPAHASSASDLIKQGNRAYKNGNYDEALTAYDKASVDKPESPYIYFNKGTAYYMKGDYKKAADSFEQAGLKSKELKLEALSQYNLGNCSFRESQRQMDSDLQKSVEALQQAIRNYQKAIELDPSLKDAAHNIEVARLTMKQLLDEIKKREQEAKKKQEQQEKALNQLKNLIERQQKTAEDTKSLDKEKEQQGDLSKLQDRARNIAEKQKELKNETENLAKQMGASSDQNDSASKEAKKHLEQAVSEQIGAEQNLRKGDISNAFKGQEKATEDMKEALEALSQKNGQNSQQDKQGQKEKKGADQQKPDSQPQGKEPEQMNQPLQAAVPHDQTAQDILNAERENRERRQIDLQGGYRPVEKDW